MAVSETHDNVWLAKKAHKLHTVARSPEIARTWFSEEQEQVAMASTLPFGSGFHLAVVSCKPGKESMTTFLSTPAWHIC